MSESRSEPDPVTIEEADLPGIGKRHDFLTRAGRRIGVVAHRGGRRDLVLYDQRDPDRCCESVALTTEEGEVLAQLLGAPRIVERLARLHEQLAGLLSEQLTLTTESPYAGRPLGDTRARTRTGASIVAVLRGGEVIASPGPDFRLEPGDGIVVVGTQAGVEAVARILTDG
ncbi:MAG TPA: cation:proton antiporter regulatory subunit [Chloroflexota bacterium]|nr:cation:proton antiporter regulatory subunit [Chloroflexota bacterium]